MATELAPAKLNLYLHVVGRRDDGYHLLDSLVAFAEIGDVLHAVDADGLSLTIGGRFAGQLAGETDNLVLRAARTLATEAGIAPRARLMLEKRLPVASGIGGGSADAAATLRLLCRLWGVTPDPAVLPRIALALGADVPACLRSRSARMGGVGDRLDPPPILPECGVVLINPGIGVPTASVFRARTGPFSPPAELPSRWDDATTMAADLGALRNDLETAAQDLAPAIGSVLAMLRAQPGCLLARMSGSGGTCFGLFPDPDAALQVATELARPRWWIWGGRLRPG